MEYEGPLDLLGIDQDGDLIVFELKRGTLTREAVAQIIDYASYLDSLKRETLLSILLTAPAMVELIRLRTLRVGTRNNFPEI